MVDTKSNMQLADLNYIPHGGKNSKTPLIVLLESDYILSQDHSTIDNFVLASFMIQNTSIASKIRKVRSKRKIQCMQLYYKSTCRSDLKSPRNSIFFICTDMNTHMITNHLRISVLISFICTDTINVYQCITCAVNIIRKYRLMLLRSIVLH